MHKLKQLLFTLFIITLIAIPVLSDEYDDLFNDIPTESAAEESESSSGGGGEFSPGYDFTLTLSGEHSFLFHVPVSPDYLNFQEYARAPKLKNELGIEINYKMLKLVSLWQLDLVMNEWGDITRLLEAGPLENYLAVSPWKFKFGMGFQKYSWGTGDGLNPTDNLNPQDYRGGFNTEKLPVLSAYAGFFPHDIISLEAIYIPFEQSDRLPVDITAELQKTLTTTTISPKPLDYDFRSFILGGKVGFFMQYADFSFSYLYDIDSFYSPIITSMNEVSMGPVSIFTPANIDLRKKRLHHFGADFKTTAGIFGIWGELCYTMSEDYLLNNYALRNHKLSWVAGFDFNYGPNDDFYFNLQYTGDFIPGFDTNFYKDYKDGKPEVGKDRAYYEEYTYRALTNKLGGVREGLTQALMVKMEWPVLNKLLTPALTTGYSLPLIYDYYRENRYGSLLINPELDIMPIDSLHIIIGANLAYSWHKMVNESVKIDEEDRFGALYKYNNIYLEVRYKWGVDIKK